MADNETVQKYLSEHPLQQFHDTVSLQHLDLQSIKKVLLWNYGPAELCEYRERNGFEIDPAWFEDSKPNAVCRVVEFVIAKLAHKGTPYFDEVKHR